MNYLDMRGLATELTDLRERRDDPDAEVLDADEHDRLAMLEQLESDLGKALDKAEDDGPYVPDEGFTDYARELAEDIHGREVTHASWPFSCINWEEAADELRCDYGTVEFDGTTYLYRA